MNVRASTPLSFPAGRWLHQAAAAWHQGAVKSLLLLLFAIGLTFLAGCAEAALPVCGYRVKQSYPHDPQAFTQGLFYRDGYLFESTGHEGRSTIRKVRVADGAVLQQVAIAPNLFGEGIVDWKDEIVSLTWRGGIGFRWKLRSFEQIGSFRYAGEGWGLARNNRSIILSDGTDTLRFLDPATLRETSRLKVSAEGRPVTMLNELEWVKGEILANVWQTDRIARIDPATGKVKAWINLAGLRKAVRASGSDDVLNGIAYDSRGDRLFVTGKNWSRLFEIRLTGC